MKYGYLALSLLPANTLKLVRAILLCLHRDEGRVTW